MFLVSSATVRILVAAPKKSPICCCIADQLTTENREGAEEIRKKTRAGVCIPVMSSAVACRAVVQRRWETPLTFVWDKKLEILDLARNDKG